MEVIEDCTGRAAIITASLLLVSKWFAFIREYAITCMTKRPTQTYRIFTRMQRRLFKNAVLVCQISQSSRLAITSTSITGVCVFFFVYQEFTNSLKPLSFSAANAFLTESYTSCCRGIRSLISRSRELLYSATSPVKAIILKILRVTS